MEYVVAANPYDHRFKQSISDPNYPWPNLLVKVNGEAILDQPAGKHITQGTHRLKFSPSLLRKGKNVVEINWKPIPEDLKGQLVYGYIYLGADKTRTGDKHRIRLLLKIGASRP